MVTLTKTVLVEWGLGWGKCLTEMGLKRVGGAELSTANADDCFRNCFAKRKQKMEPSLVGEVGSKKVFAFSLREINYF